MRRALVLVLLALVPVIHPAALADDRKEKSVTTFVVQDAATLRVEGDTLLGPLVAANEPFDRACVSVNADTPGHSTVAVFARVHLAGDARTDWLPLGVVGRPDAKARIPRSAEPFTAESAKVDIDTIVLPGAKGRALEVKLVLAAAASDSPHVRRVAVVAWPHGARDADPPAGAPHPAWGKVLDVPERSQRVEDPKISGRICSATSLGMVLAFHGVKLETAAVCSEVHDNQAGIYGNWALNVAFAGRLGLDAAIGRFGSFAPLEAEIAAGRPVVITHRWLAGELTGSPVSATDGHLIVVRGFTKDGDLVVNDPAADPRRDQKIERIYKRSEIARTWLDRGDGVVYLVSPRPESKDAK